MRQRIKSGMWIIGLAVPAIMLGTAAKGQEASCSATTSPGDTITDTSQGTGGEPGVFGATGSVTAPDDPVPTVPAPTSSSDLPVPDNVGDSNTPSPSQLGALMIPLVDLLQTLGDIQAPNNAVPVGNNVPATKPVAKAPPDNPTTHDKDTEPVLGIALKRDDDSWVPEDPSTTTATATIYQRDAGSNKWAPCSARRRIFFEFVQRSSEKGSCLNKSSEGDSAHQQTPDLFFEHSKNRDMDCAYYYSNSAYTLEQVNSQKVVLTCRDWGAWSTVQATARDCVPLKYVGNDVQGPVLQEAADVKIPKDDNNNQIADGYVDINNDDMRDEPKPEADLDANPVGNGVVGDGLSAYEEYRGFFVSGVHKRTGWKDKDLFIRDRDGIGFGNFETASKLTCHKIKPDEYNGDDKKIINFNSGKANVVAQHGLLLETFHLAPDLGGLTSAIGPPRNVQWVRIQNTPAISYFAIAHELGHGVGIEHHGDGYWSMKKDDWVTATRTSGNCACGLTLPAMFYRGQKHNECSGVWECIMRYYYNPLTIYERAGRYECPPNDSPNLSFCESSVGNGPNRGDRFAGDAARGNCIHKIIVNDK